MNIEIEGNFNGWKKTKSNCFGISTKSGKITEGYHRI